MILQGPDKIRAVLQNDWPVGGDLTDHLDHGAKILISITVARESKTDENLVLICRRIMYKF